MSHTEHGEKGLQHHAATAHNAAAHHEHIAVAAYFLAEHRNFDGGDPVADWLAAETGIDAKLKHRNDPQIH